MGGVAYIIKINTICFAKYHIDKDTDAYPHVIWQYDTADVLGVQYICNRDEGYVDYSVEIKRDGWNNYKTGAEQLKPQKIVDELAREVLNGLWGVG